MKVIGIKKGGFTDKQGNDIKFYQLHCVLEDERIEGLSVEIIKVPKFLLETFNKIKLNDMISVLYNKYGSVQSIEIN